MGKETREEIVKKISELKTIIEKAQYDHQKTYDYGKKVKELMYWRRRLTQKGNHDKSQ